MTGKKENKRYMRKTRPLLSVFCTLHWRQKPLPAKKLHTSRFLMMMAGGAAAGLGAKGGTQNVALQLQDHPGTAAAATSC